MSGFLQLEDAQVFDLPDELPEICVAVSGPRSTQIAIDLGDGLFATEPKAKPAWAPTADEAAQAIVENGRFALTGWEVLTELPNPVNFDAATQTVTKEDALSFAACGPGVERHVEVAQEFVDAGFDHLVTQVQGPDPDGFIDFFRTELGDRRRSLTPAAR